jgi:hypothetical protein
MAAQAVFALHVVPSVQHAVVRHALHVGSGETKPPHVPPSDGVGVFTPLLPLEHATMIAPSPTRNPNFVVVFRTRCRLSRGDPSTVSERLLGFYSAATPLSFSYDS